MKHVVVNKVVEESVQEGYVERLSKGQAVGVDQLEQVRAASTRTCVKARQADRAGEMPLHSSRGVFGVFPACKRHSCPFRTPPHSKIYTSISMKETLMNSMPTRFL